MKNYKKIIKKIVKDFIFKIKLSLFKNLKEINKIKLSLFKNYEKIKNLFDKKSKSKISTFNKSLISFIIILFFYLFYLTIPTFYGQSWIQNKIEKKLVSEFKINFSLSSDITYQILPSPNFIIKNVKILDDSNEVSNTFGRVKTFKVFISQKNLFNKEKIKFKKILVKDANFLIDQKNFYFFEKFTNKVFSTNKIKIKKSNLFFKDATGETLLINKITDSSLYFNKKTLLNIIELNGEALNIPYKLNYKKSLINKQVTTSIKLKKLRINYLNELNQINKNYEGVNTISSLNYKLKTEYEYKNKNKNLSFRSKSVRVPNNSISYNGELNLDPFDLNINIEINKININKVLDTESILFSFIKSGLLFNSNISANIFLNSEKILDHRLLKELNINFIVKEGNLIFDNSQFTIDKIGFLKLTNGVITKKNNKFTFYGNFNLKLNDSGKFFSFIQLQKNKRKLIKNIYFNIEFDFLNNQLYLNNFKIDNLKSNLETKNILDNFNNDKEQIKNLIMLNNLMKKIISSYLG
jgi:hypothetical protein